MEIFNEYIAMWKNYVNFKDRTTVRGFWMAVLWNFVISFVLGLLGRLLNNTVLTTIYGLAACIPMLAISVRRLHDAGKHWAWIFLEILASILVVCATAVLLSGALYGSASSMFLGVVLALGALAAAIYLIMLLCKQSAPADGFNIV